jgi:preprotein translocase subunit SecD
MEPSCYKQQGGEKMQKINTTSLIKIVIVFLAVVLLAVFSYKPIIQRVNLGLDLKGGLHVVMQAQEKPGQKITSDTIQKSVGILRNRVDQFGVKEPVIQIEGTRRVIVELPGVADPEQAATVLGRTAQLEFRDENGNVIVTGSDLKDAQAELNSQTNQPEVSLTFNSEGAKKFADFTAKNVGKTLAIVLDGKVQEAPKIDEPIPNGKARISGGYETLKDAEQTAVLLRSGSLPVTLNIVDKTTVGPVLGSDSLDKSIKAGIIGLLMIFIFMIGYYRVPGSVPDIVLGHRDGGPGPAGFHPDSAGYCRVHLIGRYGGGLQYHYL